MQYLHNHGIHNQTVNTLGKGSLCLRVINLVKLWMVEMCEHLLYNSMLTLLGRFIQKSHLMWAN